MLLIADKNNDITISFNIQAIDKLVNSTGATMTNEYNSVMFRSID